MWHLFSERTGHSVPLGRHFFIQVLFGACVSVSGSAHCTVATRWAHNHQTGFYRASEGRRERFYVSPSVCTFKCTYDIHLHLVVMAAGPAASRMPSSFTDSKIDNWGGGGSSFLSRVLLSAPDLISPERTVRLRLPGSAGVLNCISRMSCQCFQKQVCHVLKFWQGSEGLGVWSQ